MSGAKILGTTIITNLLRRNARFAFTQQRQLQTNEDFKKYWAERIGNREVVGYGMNGQPQYFDSVSFPFPSIRFKEPTPEIQALREKERGDWRRLSADEKKGLYRASFCQTFVEFEAPTGDWMAITGSVLLLTCCGIWCFMLVKIYAYGEELPASFSKNSKRAQLRRMIDIQVNPINGLTSNWDYEKNDWKRKGWFTPENPFLEDDEEECPEEDE